MEELYVADHGGEDELLGHGSSIDAMAQHHRSSSASAIAHPTETFDLKSAPGWSKESSAPSARIDPKGRGTVERDQCSEVRVTIWNSTQQRKISGNAAPMEKNVEEYLRKHPDCAIYDGQDKNASKHHPADERASPRSRSAADGDQHRRVAIWNRVEKRKLSGNCAPLEKNLEQYLKDNPHCEVHSSDQLVKGKKVTKKQRKDAAGLLVGDVLPRGTTSASDIANGHQGFVFYDPFSGESAAKPEETVIDPKMTLETLMIKPNPKIEGLVLPKFGLEGTMLSPAKPRAQDTTGSTSRVSNNTAIVG